MSAMDESVASEVMKSKIVFNSCLGGPFDCMVASRGWFFFCFFFFFGDGGNVLRVPLVVVSDGRERLRRFGAIVIVDPVSSQFGSMLTEVEASARRDITCVRYIIFGYLGTTTDDLTQAMCLRAVCNACSPLESVNVKWFLHRPSLLGKHLRVSLSKLIFDVFVHTRGTKL